MTAIPDPAALKRDAAARALDFIKARPRFY